MSSLTSNDAVREAVEPGSTVRCVDADVHPVVPPDRLAQRLPSRWRHHLDTFGRRTPHYADPYPRLVNGGGPRADAWPEGEGAFPGTDPLFARKQLLDEYDIGFAVLNCLDAVPCMEEPAFAAAFVRAINDHLGDEWLDVDPRYVGAICVPVESPAASVAEIERLQDDPRWVQVLLPASTVEPLGSEKYRPIFAAALEAGLPVAAHFGGWDQHSGAGWPSYYIEEHVGYAVTMESQLLSAIACGLFDEMPGLQFVMAECGVTWLTALRHAMDEAWGLLGASAPRLERRPSEILDSNVWCTTQPFEEPDSDADFVTAVELGNLTERMLFSTDYPHWDFDSPTQALPRSLSAEDRQRILAGNACSLYRFPPPALGPQRQHGSA